MGKLGLIPHHHCDVTSRGEVVIRLIQMQYINDINGLIILKKKHTHYIIIIPSIHIPFSYRFLPCQNPPCFLGDLRPQFKSCVKPQLVPWLFFFRIGLPSVLGIAQDCSELHPPSVFGHEIGM